MALSEKGPIERWHLLQLPLSFVVTLFALGLPAALTKAGDETGITTIWQAFTVSTPLTVAVLLITFLVIRGQLNAWGALAIFVGAAVLSYYFGITATGHKLEQAWTTTACLGQFCTTSHLDFWPPQVIVGHLLGVYWHLYGPAGFVGSVTTGIFLAWYLNRGYLKQAASPKAQTSEPAALENS